MGNPSVAAIVQARMGSTRLPGKMLIPLYEEKGALELMLGRIARAQRVDRIVVATTVGAADDALATLCARLGFDCFRGSENDVLDRYYQAARRMGSPSVLVRLTGDCPLHDPDVVDEVIGAYEEGGADYVANVEPPTYPDGLDTEVFSFGALESAWRDAALKSEREHVTPYIRNHRERFAVRNVACSTDWSSLRWTLDEPADVEFIRAVFSALGDRPFGMRDVLELLRRQPALLRLNAGIIRNEGYLKSLKEDGLAP